MPEPTSSLPPGVVANESVVPLLPCVDDDATVDFWTSLGFAITWQQRKPYLYLAFAWSGFELHYGRAPSGIDPADETAGGCLVMVDDVAAYHSAFVTAMRDTYGKVLSKGRPRITRYRAGASRFSITDPNGNTIIVIQRDEPQELDYGGSKELVGLAKAIDNARILREFKNDDRSRASARAAVADPSILDAYLQSVVTDHYLRAARQQRCRRQAEHRMERITEMRR